MPFSESVKIIMLILNFKYMLEVTIIAHGVIVNFVI
jgi:hypothetical protein